MLLYRTVRNIRDYSGGHNHFLTPDDLRELSYPALLKMLRTLKKEGVHERFGRAA